MSLLGEQLAAPAIPADHDVEQVLLGLADGSYVLSTPDGRVAECGVGVARLLNSSPGDLAGHPVADVLIADPQQRGAFERLLRGERDDSVFFATAAGGAARSLRFVVILVPLALGWEFTSLLSELGSRDADSWEPEELRVRHERALGAVESVCGTGVQPDSGARLAGILVTVRDADAPPLTRAVVGEHLELYRAAAREAKEAARRASLGLSELYEDEPAAVGPDLDDLVGRAHELRERIDAAEREAAGANAERDQAMTRLAEVEAERDAERDAGAGRIEAVQTELAARHQRALAELTQAVAGRDEALTNLAAAQAQHAAEQAQTISRLQTVEAERERALAQSASEQAERARVLAHLQAEQAERSQVLARLAEVEAERERERERREAAEEHANGAQQSAHGRLEQLARERDEAHAAAVGAAAAREQADAAVHAARAEAHEAIETARAEAHAALAEAQSARAGADDARAETEAARADGDHVRAELQALRDSIRSERESIVTADAEMQVLRCELQAAQADCAAAREDAQAARGEHALTRGELAAVRAELGDARGQLERVRDELEAVRSRPVASPDELDAVRAELTTTSAELDAVRVELTTTTAQRESLRAGAEQAREERDEALRRGAELLAEAERARAAVEAIRAEFSFEPSARPGPTQERVPFSAPAPRPLAAAAFTPASAAPEGPELPSVEPGFAAALVGFDGRFKRLDEAFCALLGAGEAELRNARWPSIIDRDNLKEHAEIARALRAGEIQSADIETIYMHARGLLVPVEGTVSLHRDAAGEAHVLFRADVRRTSGAPH